MSLARSDRHAASRSRPTGPVAEAIARSSAVDLVLLAAVPVALVVVYALPEPTKRGLSLAYTAPTPLTAFSAHFVHFEPAHLLGNLLVYLLVAPLAYVLCVLSDHRWRFRTTFLTAVLVFPFALSALNAALIRPRIGFGFSGVNLALLGFLPIALAGFLRTRLDAPVGLERAPVFFFLTTGLIALLVVPSPETTGVLVGGSLFGAALFVPHRPDSPATIVASCRRAAARAGEFELAVAAGIVVFGLPVALFPADPAGGTGLLNVYGHQLGFCLGFLVPYLTFLLLDA